MKNKLLLISLLSICFLPACIKNEQVIFKGAQLEFDAASWNANAAGLSYPIIPRNLPLGRVAGPSDSTLRRYPHTVVIRVNLIGAQSPEDRSMTYEVFGSPITSVSFPATITGQTPAAPAATLAVSNAVAGTHYAPLSGTVTIPANSSFGYINLQILNPGPSAGQARFIGLRLLSSSNMTPAVNYREIGLVIDQR